DLGGPLRRLLLGARRLTFGILLGLPALALFLGGAFGSFLLGRQRLVAFALLGLGGLLRRFLFGASSIVLGRLVGLALFLGGTLCGFLLGADGLVLGRLVGLAPLFRGLLGSLAFGRQRGLFAFALLDLGGSFRRLLLGALGIDADRKERIDAFGLRRFLGGLLGGARSLVERRGLDALTPHLRGTLRRLLFGAGGLVLGRLGGFAFFLRSALGRLFPGRRRGFLALALLDLGGSFRRLLLG